MKLSFLRKPFHLFPYFHQLELMDCGPSCLRMVAKFYGKKLSLNYLRKVCHLSRTGISMKGLYEGAKAIGFNAIAVKIPFQSNSDETSLFNAPLPNIVYWNRNHFVVVYKITKRSIYIADPAKGKLKLSYQQFKDKWLQEIDVGVTLLLKPKTQFYTIIEEVDDKKSLSLIFLLKYLKPYKKFGWLLLTSLLLASLIQVLFPILTKSLVDIGINQQNISFIYLVLLAQLVLYISQTIINFFQRWITLHISSRINIFLSSDFLYKLTRLPIAFFDNSMFGDIFQRINDHRKVETFFSASSIATVFSFFSLILFTIILLVYNSLVFLIFIIGSILYILWVVFFLKKRKVIDYELFQEYASNNDMLYELIYGMQEVKLQNSEKKRALSWTKAQEKLFKINIRSTILTQYQDGGAFFINQIKDILITIISAIAVTQGKMSIGMLLATQYIIGQLNAPLQQIVGFLRVGYEAKLSMDRITEIHQKPEEHIIQSHGSPVMQENVYIKNVYFKYNALDDWVLKDVSFSLPKGKVTAIVGSSGSGKTTLVKLLLGFYPPQHGEIEVGHKNLKNIPSNQWRAVCGAVLQDGYIFSDTIANNIAESSTEIDHERLYHAMTVANINSYVDSLALKHNTYVGAKGNGISQGQKQRLLISRAVYKNPEYLFFDEATNALDSRNEKVILNNLKNFYKGKTVIVVAHRLSTVRHADQIIVLENGKIVETGNHYQLVENEGCYYELIKNQLELGQ